MKRRKKRRNWPLTIILYGIVTAAVVYLAILPMIEYRQALQDGTDIAARHARWVLADTMRTRMFELLVYGWVFMFGASIGSFLNVVIYRVPRRMSLLGISKCPFCRVAIHGYDNIPVFAWIALRGRCRTCHLPISVRYPLVEFAVGAQFLVLAAVEVFQAGANLPGQSSGHPTTLGWFIGRPDWSLLAICTHHCMLLCVLFSWAWIQADGRKIPLSYLSLALAVGIIGAAIRPDVHPVPWTGGLPGWMAEFGWTERLDDSFVGFVVGAATGIAATLLGAAVRAACRFPRQPAQETVAACTTIGVYLGWQAAVSVTVIALVTEFLSTPILRLLRKNSAWPTAAILFAATLLQVLFWRWLVELAGWPFPAVEV